MSQTDRSALTGQIASIRRACLRRAAESDTALLAASQLLDLEGEIEERGFGSPESLFSPEEHALVHDTAETLRRDPDAIVAGLGARLAKLIPRSPR